MLLAKSGPPGATMSDARHAERFGDPEQFPRDLDHGVHAVALTQEVLAERPIAHDATLPMFATP